MGGSNRYQSGEDIRSERETYNEERHPCQAVVQCLRISHRIAGIGIAAAQNWRFKAPAKLSCRPEKRRVNKVNQRKVLKQLVLHRCAWITAEIQEVVRMRMRLGRSCTAKRVKAKRVSGKVSKERVKNK